MKLQNVISQRFTTDKSYWQIVFEWEDVFAKELSLTLSKDNKLRCNKIIRHIPWVSNIITTRKTSLLFEMTPDLGLRSGLNKPNIVPLIIDFYLKEDQLPLFYKRYNKHKCILISSKEVYDFLKLHKCPLPIYLLALSIANQYKIDSTTSFPKVFDLVLMGRQNAVLMKFLEEYSNNHKGFKYVYNKLDNHKYSYFTSDGVCLGSLETREDFIGMMRKAKVTFYSTPGIDGGEVRTNGFNQVTPRFLEQISSCCHVIARYPDNSDVEYYELERFCPSINSYKDFEKVLDKARTETVNLAFYSNYLAKHYTSVRAHELSNILNKL